MGTYAPTGPGNCPLLEAKRQIINDLLLACVRGNVSICQKLESTPEGGTISTLQEGRFGREVWSFRVVCLFYVPSHFECASIFLDTTRSLSRTRFQYRTLSCVIQKLVITKSSNCWLLQYGGQQLLVFMRQMGCQFRYCAFLDRRASF